MPKDAGFQLREIDRLTLLATTSVSVKTLVNSVMN